MMYSSTTLAAALNCHPATVRRWSERLKLGQELPSGLVFTEADKERIAASIKPIGCPKFKPGNKLWKKRKNVR